METQNFASLPPEILNLKLETNFLYLFRLKKSKMRKAIYLTVIVFVLGLLGAGCAKISSPTGGPKDTTPPKVLKVDPESGTVRFNQKHIRIWFDVQLYKAHSGGANILFGDHHVESVNDQNMNLKARR